MKHTTFENELNEIRRRAVQELKEALAAHNGIYNYAQFDHLPKIGGLNKIEVKEAFLLGDLPTFETEERFITASDCNLSIEDILTLTEYIVETDDVEDVSGVYPVPVTWVDCDDIESEGFDTSDVNQEKLNRIAEIMQEYSCGSTQHDIITSDLYAACTKVCLNQKED